MREAVAAATCWADTLRLLGYEVKGANHRTVQRWAVRWNVPTGHFDPNVARRRSSKARAIALEQALVENSSYPRGALKERLLASGLKQRVCEMCGQDEVWEGRRMSLVLDHINGISDDHRFKNLRIVCPNCAATLETHCGRNLPRERICPGCRKPFAPRHIRHRYCSEKCWGTVLGDRLRGVAQPTRRKVSRPSYQQLMEDVWTMSFLAVGRKYGVSDNAVRKWIRWYELATSGEDQLEAA
ncbi:MAG: HNH endonuclease [Solirubrobacteraceae bacterium]